MLALCRRAEMPSAHTRHICGEGIYSFIPTGYKAFGDAWSDDGMKAMRSSLFLSHYNQSYPPIQGDHGTKHNLIQKLMSTRTKLEVDMLPNKRSLGLYGFLQYTLGILFVISILCAIKIIFDTTPGREISPLMETLLNILGILFSAIFIISTAFFAKGLKTIGSKAYRMAYLLMAVNVVVFLSSVTEFTIAQNLALLNGIATGLDFIILTVIGISLRRNYTGNLGKLGSTMLLPVLGVAIIGIGAVTIYALTFLHLLGLFYIGSFLILIGLIMVIYGNYRLYWEILEMLFIGGEMGEDEIAQLRMA